MLVLVRQRNGLPAQYEPGTVATVTPLALRPGCSAYRLTVQGRGAAAGLRWDLCPPEWVIADQLEAEGATA